MKTLTQDQIKEANRLLDRAEEILMNIVYFNKNLVNTIRINKMKFQLRLLVLLLLLLIICSCLEKRPPVRSVSIATVPLSTFENGKLYQMLGNGNEHFKVVVLEGNWREMGRQYGYLLKEKEIDFGYRLVVTKGDDG